MLKVDSGNEWYRDSFVSNGPSQAPVPAGLLENDFIPTSYQRELARLIEDSSKVVFLPDERDKLYTALFAVKHFTSELTRFRKESRKRIFYIADSIEKTCLVTSFFRRYVSFSVGSLTSTITEECWNEFFETSQLLVVSCQLYLRFLRKFSDIPSEICLVIFDDCVHVINHEHPMKQILEKLLDFSPKILGLTSFLIPNDLEPQFVYKNLKQMEMVLKSTIITSQYCSSVKKYLTDAKVKFVKHLPFSKNWNSLNSIVSRVSCLVNDLRTFFGKVKYPESGGKVIKMKLLLLLSELQDSIENFGLYPALVLSNISSTKLEKIRLHCENSLFFSISAAIADMNLISSLLKKEIEKIAPVDSVKAIVKHCCPKIVRLLYLLVKMNYDDNCIIFVKDSVTAQMISYILQKISSSEMKMSFISADFLADYYSATDILSHREQCFYEKSKRNVLKKFRRQIINTLVLSWKTLIETDDLSADWIIYFDMPPDYLSYVVSRKYSNCTANKNFFFLEECSQKNDAKYNIDLIEPFAQLDLTLKEVLQKKDINNVEKFCQRFRKFHESDEEIDVRFTPLITEGGKKANVSTAISIVNKYCERLPGDAFSYTAPRWRIYEKDGGVTCCLQLPIQSSIRSPIEPVPISNVKLVKNVAALDAVKTLYKCNHLDDALKPTVHRANPELLHDSNLFPLWRKEDDPQTGSSSCCRVVPIHAPEWLYNCAPHPGVDCYLHIIRLKPSYRVPEVPRKKFFHELLESQNEFGIVTSKKLPAICLFPVYLDLGQLDVSIEVNVVVLKFTEEEVQKLISFHRFIFLDVLQVVKQFLVYDYSNTESSYCIVPLAPTGEGILGINWDVVNNQSVKQEIVEPSDEQKIRTDYAGNKYLGKVITPWYRILPQRYYIVTKVLADKTPNSSFSSREFQTFSEYYADKYGLEVKQPIQPLLAVRAVTTNFNCVRPRAQNPGVLRKRGEKEIDFEETLIPELCVMEPLPAVYWYKSITLLAITHRLHYILMAETIRQRIASFERTSTLDSQFEDDQDILIADRDCINEIEETVKPVVPISSILKDVKLAKRNRTVPWGNEMLLPVDVDRNLANACVLELMALHDFMKIQSEDKQKEFFELPPMIREKRRDPSLKFLNLNRKLSPGPKQRDILQALTVSQCGDIVNLERFKLTGDSFLKFAASLWLYKLYPHLNVLQLSHLKRKLIGKRNLFYCGSKLQLGSMLKLQDLSLNNDWNFGGFCLPELLVNISVSSGIPPEVIFDLEIPRNEQISGVISAETRNYLHERMLSYYNETTKEDTNFQHSELMSTNDNKNHALMYFKKQSVPDKAVVDVLKALAGVYLMNCGVEAGFKFLQCVGILETTSIQELYTFDVKSTSFDDFIDVEKLSDVINYKFKSKLLPYEAFVHHSCLLDHAANSNQKLAFLGDSILDFLITGYIYENCGEMSISEVEDIRIALVNDVLFAALLIREELHKFLIVESPSLMDKINKFVSQQEKVKYEMSNDEFLFLVEETSSRISESVDVPKALSDAFKAVIAAIFVDSSGDLKTVWNVCYNIMKHEIETFINHIPRNPVKLLYETDLVIEYEKPKPLQNDPNLLEVRMNILIDEENRSYVGIGSSKHQATRIAAKLALKDLAKKFTL